VNTTMEPHVCGELGHRALLQCIRTGRSTL
jgi:hypothetical protein